MPALALEIEDRVDHVLEHLGAGDDAFLRDVADQEDREAALLGEADQLLRRRAHLGHRAGGGFQIVDIHGLDRIDDDDSRACRGLERGRDVADVGGRGQLHRRVLEAQARGAHADLVHGLFARNIGARRARLGERPRDLEQQGRFADAGVAADEEGRAGHEAAAGDAVELGDAGGQARHLGRGALERFEGHDMAGLRGGGAGLQPAGGAGPRGFFDNRVPGAAGVAPSGPFAVNRAALLANEIGRGARH